MRITILVSNPKTGSRTLAAAATMAAALVEALDRRNAVTKVIDLAHYRDRILDWDDHGITERAARVATSEIVLVASPTYKASDTGILKAFVDRYDQKPWRQSIAVSLMIENSPRHALASDRAMPPLLLEMEAIMPCRGLYVLASDLDRFPGVIADWLSDHITAIDRLLTVG
jgi:FMN reductase